MRVSGRACTGGGAHARVRSERPARQTCAVQLRWWKLGGIQSVMGEQASKTSGSDSST